MGIIVPEIYNSGVNNNCCRGDFIGFQYGEETSASLRVIRISDGSRYNEELLPSLNDRTAQVAGVNQTYYFGTDYPDRQIVLEVAFDDLTETEFRKLSYVFGKKEPQRLIFDETPYKYYMVKPNSAPQFKYICFNEERDGKIQRIYKGEGTINLVAYYPFAKSVHNYLDEFFIPSSDENANWEKVDDIWVKVTQFDAQGKPIHEDGHQYYLQKDLNAYLDNIEEWKDSSNLLDNKKIDGEDYYDILLNKVDGYYINTHNAGDMVSELQIQIIPSVDDNKTIPAMSIRSLNKKINFKKITLKGSDEYIIIDSKLHSIRGAIHVDNIYTNNIYNEYLETYDFPKFDLGEENGKPFRESTIHFEGTDLNLDNYDVTIKYNHIYY